MRRGVTGAGFEESRGGLDDGALVPARRRVLRRGGRFSASVIVSKMEDETRVGDTNEEVC